MARAKTSKNPARHPSVPHALRDAVQLRDAFTCVYCGSTGSPELSMVLTIDHVIPTHFGGGH